VRKASLHNVSSVHIGGREMATRGAGQQRRFPKGALDERRGPPKVYRETKRQWKRMNTGRSELNGGTKKSDEM